MNKEVRNFRRVAELAGINVNWFGEVISNKTHKFYKSINKIGQNLEVFDKVLKECKKFNISNVTVLDCDKWVGNYGRVLSDAEIINTRHIRSHVEANIKYIWRVLRGLYNWNNEGKYILVKVDTNDESELFDLYYIPQGFKKIEYGEKENEILLLMANGQLFDVGHQYYYSKHDSKELKQYIKDHGYDGPNDFYENTNNTAYAFSEEGYEE